MYLPGSILYFTPFYFKDGKSSSKNKYFLCLCHDGEDMIVASLPSSQDYVPAFIKKQHGCIDVPEGNFNCYHFGEDVPVTITGWSFPKPTYVYANWIDTFSLGIFKDVYVLEGIDYEIVGRLTPAEFEAVIRCFLSASSIKRKYKRLLLEAKY